MEKERRTKVLVLSTLVVVVATLSIAFAAMSQVLNINGIGKMDTASWSVYFDNLGEANIVRGAEEVGKPSISDDNGTVQDINVKLSNPKDEISYTVDIVNDGTIDAEITMLKDIELTDVQKKVFEFKVTYTDTGEILQNGDILPKDTTKNITISIKFRDDITEFDLPTEQQTISLSYQVTYTQYDGGNMEVEPDGGEDENLPRYVLSKSWSSNIGISSSSDVEEVSFLRSTVVPEHAADTVFDASEVGDNSVIGWYEDSDSNGLYEVYLCANGIITAPEDSSILFFNMKMLKNINFDNNFDTSNVTQMGGIFFTPLPNFRGMFWGCSSLTELDLSSFNTSNVTYIPYMFHGCSSLSSLNLSSFNTSKVTNMSTMFYNCTALTNLNLSNFDTSNVTNMISMFSGCSSLTTLNLNNFNTSKVTGMSSMFKNCTSLTSLDVSNFNTSNVTTMQEMFHGCSSLSSLNVSTFNTSNVTDMSSMFYDCQSLTSLDLSDFNTSNVTDMDYMFQDCNSLVGLNITSFNTQNVTTMNDMFYKCTSLASLDFRNADFSNVSSYRDMFYSVPTSSQIVVKDETQRTWMTTNFPELTNVVLPSEL